MRPQAEFDASHYALTLHLPPEAARQPQAREAAREKLRSVCVEGGFGIAVLTSGDPVAMTLDAAPPAATAGACLGADEVKLLVHEFVRAGFRRVGILSGGFAALPAEARTTLVYDEVAPLTRGDGGAGGGAVKSRLGSLIDEGGQRMNALFGGRRARAKPAPTM